MYMAFSKLFLGLLQHIMVLTCKSGHHVFRPFSTLRRLPVNVLRRHFDVTRLAVNAAKNIYNQYMW